MFSKVQTFLGSTKGGLLGSYQRMLCSCVFSEFRKIAKH